jgi:beta-galactosidase
MYSVTGWGDGSVPPNEVIPLVGWLSLMNPGILILKKSPGAAIFNSMTFRDDDKIGNNLAQKKNKYMDYSMDPYFTCEMGVGVQNTYHRRLVINSIDGSLQWLMQKRDQEVTF